MIHPRARQRTDAVMVRAGLSRELTNADLLGAFTRSAKGKLAGKTIQRYASLIRDALLYHTHPEGGEVHVSLWTKEMVWEYVHFCEANYCRFYAPVFIGTAAGTAACRRKVWIGPLPPEAATEDHCRSCGLFEPSPDGIQERLKALNRFFKFLARSGVVAVNFVRDLVSDYRHDLRSEGRKERRRNPSVEEMVKLVNGTASLRNRAFYAASAKWGARPNEMLMLDRYDSFPDFDQGGYLAFLPRLKGRLDKRKGNRVFVIDAELRPILKQYFAWWEHAVKRDADGKPLTTALWLTQQGRPLKLDASFYDVLFYPDCERLGLMKAGERGDSLLRWTAHCQRHFLEKVLTMLDCPETWRKHFRGDAVKDALGDYFVPKPEEVREKYLQWVPFFGFSPMPEAKVPELPASARMDKAELHAAILRAGLNRVLAWSSGSGPVLSLRVVKVDASGEPLRTIAVVPKTRAPSFLAAYQRLHPDAQLALSLDPSWPPHGPTFSKFRLVELYEEALAALGPTAEG